MTLTEILHLLPSARKHGQQWKARCPAHEDRQASLSLSEGSEGRVLLKCFAGCTTKAVCAALGISQAGLFSADHSSNASSRASPQQIVAQYDYQDEEGRLLFQSVRYEPKRFTQRRPNGKGGWLYNLSGVRRVLYHLPELLAAAPDATVFICEGEKDVERLRSLGLVATCNPQGAGKWRDEYNEALRGREIVLLPDNDPPGRAHAETVAQSLHRIAASVKVLPLPNLPAKGDVSDWLDAGGEAESLCVMAEAAPEWEPTAGKMPTAVLDEDVPPLLQTWAEFDAEEMPEGEQIIYELERGELGLLAAVTNVGKSTFLRNLALALACGGEFAPVVVKGGPPRRVLLLDFETRRVRLQRDLRKMIRFCTKEEQALIGQNLAVAVEARINDEPLSLSNPEHLNWVRMNAIALKADLVIIDTVAAAFTIREENSNAEVSSAILKPLLKLAQETSAAILMAHHIGKSRSEDGQTGEKAYRARGASSFGAFASLVLNLMQDQHNEDRKVLSLGKAKGPKFEDTVLALDRETRWMRAADTPVIETPTSYKLVMALFKDGREIRTREVIAALAGQVSERQAKRCLSEAVRNGELEMPTVGKYRIVPSVPSLIGVAQMAQNSEVD